MSSCRPSKPSSRHAEDEEVDILKPLLLDKDRRQLEQSSTKPPVWINTANMPDSQPNSRKRGLSTIRRPSMFSLGMRHVREISRSVKSVADNELKFEAIRFAHTTTAHGVSMALNSHVWYGRWIWLSLSIFSLSLFLYQSYFVLQKYHRKDKIVNVELQFESAPFPAVTVCNLNPFKKHLARSVPQISETLDAFHQAVTYSKDANQRLETMLRSRRSTTHPGGFRYVQYEPVMSDCNCLRSKRTKKVECAQKDSIPASNDTMCICNFDRQDSTAWPCFPASAWTTNVCPECNDIGYCNLPGTTGNNNVPCLCQTDRRYCLIKPQRMKRLWEIKGTRIPDESSPFRAEFLEQLKELGFANVTDEVAITTKTTEKLILIMAGLQFHHRIALSYGKSEFIRMCSFNGQQCDIINDFKLHVDAAFGNCYTFNGSPHKNLSSTRAGPSYGLRLLIYINTTDYLPTTQATGVRIAIHGKEEYPFPDTFGYSGPTGAVSSFGLAMRKVHRLLPPIGDCVPSSQNLPSWYIFRNYKYEPEACFKSCYQSRIIQRCGCADPRYPTARNETKLCDSLEVFSRTCLLRESKLFSRNYMCPCKHPCEQDLFTTTYSASRLTNHAFAARCEGKDCLERFDSESTAFVEIYYEQMSYEVLTEREAYSFVNFMSDVGGQAGLWLGASVITLFEFAYFIFRVITLACRKRSRELERRLQYDSNGRHNSDVYNEPNEVKKSVGDIRFTLTPAHSIEDFNDTEDMDLDEHLDLPTSQKDTPDQLDTTSLEEKLNSIRNANFTITV